MARTLHELTIEWRDAQTKRIFTELRVLRNTIDEVLNEFGDPARIPEGVRISDIEFQLLQVTEAFQMAIDFDALLEYEKDENEEG